MPVKPADDNPFIENATESDPSGDLIQRQLAAQIEAEQASKATAPTGLFALMLAPLVLIAIPILLLVVLRSTTANNAVTPPTTENQVATTSQTPLVSPIPWQTSFDEALALAQKTGKPVMADFYADWCGPCKAMDAYTWTDASVVEEAKNVIPVKVNVDLPQNNAVSQRYNINPLPTVLWVDPNGTEKGRNEGAVGPPDMLTLMQKYR